MTAGSVIRRAVRNLAWMFAHTWVSAVFGLVSFTIMARILGPEPYGIMALAGLVFGIDPLDLNLKLPGIGRIGPAPNPHR